MDKELVSRVIKEINSNDDFVIRNYYQSCFRVCEQLEKYFEKYNVVNPIDKYFWLNIGEGLIFQNMNLIMLKWMITKNLH